MTNLDIITRNFFKMMRSGALNEYVVLEPMSAFKWNRLIEIVETQGVISVASRAIKNQQYETTFNMPQVLREKVHRLASVTPEESIQLEMTSSILNKKLAKIHVLERKAEDYSKESLDLFNIIIANCQAMLNKGTSTRLIIQLGNYIRIMGDKVDYAKVDKWLKEMQMLKVAQLVGSILITNFAFKPEELPFVKKVDPKAALVMRHCIMERKMEKHNRGITYFEYAPLENASILIGRLKTRLDTIEE